MVTSEGLDDMVHARNRWYGLVVVAVVVVEVVEVVEWSTYSS